MGRPADLWRELLAVAIVSAAFLALGAYYALSSPLYSRPDEPVHYAYALHLRGGKGLPMVDMARMGARNDVPVEMEAHQPPLYYAAVAALSSLAPPGPDPAPAMNPYFFTTPEDKRTLWVASYAASPLEAPVFFTGRFLSLFSGLLALVFAYLLVRLFLPWQVAALAMALMGLSPQFLFISSSFSNDMASTATAHLGLWQLGVTLKRGLTARRGLALGLSVALATLTKLGGLGLLVPLGLVALWQAWRTRRLAPVAWAALAGALALLVASWWFWRNWQLYGNPLALNVLPVLLGPAPEVFGGEQWRSLLEWIAKSYFLDFGPAGFVLAELPVYWAVGALFALSVVGTVLALRSEKGARPLFALLWVWFGIVLASVLSITVSTHIVMGGGRLLLPAAAAVATTLAVGLAELARRRVALVAALAVVLGVYAALAPARYPDPRYPRFEVVANLAQPPSHQAEAYFGEAADLHLLGYDLALAETDGGRQSLELTYYWRTERSTERDLTLFVHLLGEEKGRAVMRAQFDTYPAYGAFPTSRWRSGYLFVDHLSLTLPPRGQRADGQLLTGFYDRANGQRLRAVDGSGKELPHSAAPLAEIRTLPSGDRQVVVRGAVVAQARGVPEIGQMVGARFGDALELVGLAAGEIDLRPGKPWQTHLFWRALKPMAEDYVVSLQLLDAGGKLVAQADGQPLEGSHPTSRWRSGENVVDVRSLTAPAGAAPGAYELRVVVYRHPSLERLPLTGGQGGGDYALAARVNLRP
mgnify:CR=1 FL=1